jgi:methylase of polypeptide subunit release factors
MSKNQGMYYTPKEIIDPAAGTGAYLKNAADMLVSNPPYAAQHSVQRMGLLARLFKWLAQIAHR